jgi:hypothetical protein
MDTSAEEITRTVRINAPRPAEVNPDVTIVLRKSHQFIVVRVGDVHQDKLRVEITSKQGTHITRGDAPHWHPIIACIVTCVNFKGEVVFNCELNTARPAPISETEPCCFINVCGRFCKYGIKRSRSLCVASLDPVERPVVSML